MNNALVCKEVTHLFLLISLSISLGSMRLMLNLLLINDLYNVNE